ncbi:hypothetical protein LEN26_016566 [Aphanomyces euteiches]|nr:hypothetical protein LEN26_016566 [Aphanomyces euteiches]KAH9104816.1 hypothetical protein AeMF1_019237 [Aphanomyces euteiches]KAH9184188.1 hypothetical protein AeNC1_013837 [Aphanomyces euteiches]
MMLAVLLVALAAICDIGSSENDATFLYRSYQEMVRTMKELNASHPDLVDLFVAQEVYDLPYPDELMCAEDDVGTVPCKQYVMRITNESTMNADRPEVFFSGALHGDERIGPQAAIELALLLVDYASSYAAGQADRSREWLSRLVNTRAIYIIPMTNAHGYFHNKRQELDIDPNRDYNYKKDGDCMEAMTSRVINEIWRDHLFQVAITFHGGMRCVTYEWGAPNHMIDGTRSARSPDDTSLVLLGTALSTFAGPFDDGNLYPTGTMNDVVYGVYGGMEDWAYAASWENQFADSPVFTPCQPQQYGGYPAAKTQYNNMTHRTFNILVETSDSKHPSEKSLGKKAALYDADLEALPTSPLGHVPQNVRLGLLLIDVVQPYLVFHDVSARKWQPEPSSCVAMKSDAVIVDCTLGSNQTSCNISKETTHVRVVWEVLGSFSVDETFLQLSSSGTFPPAHTVATKVQSGPTQRQFYVKGASPPLTKLNGPYFMECIDLTTASVEFIRAVAKVDQNWASQDVPASPSVPPQSHLVNARTNDAYRMEWNGHRIQGASYFYSQAIHLTYSSHVEVEKPGGDRSSPTPFSAAIVIAGVSFATLAILTVWFVLRRNLRKYKRTPTNEPIDESSVQDADKADNADDMDETGEEERQKDHDSV